MEYVDWKDPKTALRYIDADDPFISQEKENGLPPPINEID
ncbi:Uncharacterised protein [Zhongshania aliphaticivorans]|nr:Uncharacterised protein [Zhongshania aliphaticivorans]